MAHGGAREQQIARIEIGAQPLGIDRVPVEHQDVGRLAGRERAAVVLVGDREAPVLERHSQHRRAVDIGRERGALVQQVGEPHLAQRVVVLVERRAVEAERHAAAALDHLLERRDAGAQMQVRAGVDRDGRAALGDQLQFVGPRPGAMRERQPRAEEADAVEEFHDAAGIIGVGPGALGAGFQQMHVDAAAGRARRRARSPRAARACTTAPPAGRIARRTSGWPRPRRPHRPARSAHRPAAAGGGSAARFPRAPAATARPGSAPTGRRPADCGCASRRRSRRARRRRAAARATSATSVGRSVRPCTRV